MKKSIILLTVLVIAIAALGVWYFMTGKGYCDVVYKENPHTKKLVVSCDDTHCTATCYLEYRKKNVEDEWSSVTGSHDFDTTKNEYRCVCKK